MSGTCKKFNNYVIVLKMKICSVFKKWKYGVCLIVIGLICEFSGHFNSYSLPIAEFSKIELDTEFELNRIQNKLFEKKRFIFAENIMELEYKFDKKTQFGNTDATLNWLAITHLGIISDDLKIIQVGNVIKLIVLKIRVFDTENYPAHKVDFKTTLPWLDQSPIRAFRQDKYSLATKALNLKQEKATIIESCSESLKNYILPILTGRSQSIELEVEINKALILDCRRLVKQQTPLDNCKCRIICNDIKKYH
jgi:hypothetical protein